MKIKIDDIIRDYLALRGESPDLLPELEEGERSAVLTLADELKARLPAAAVKSTLDTPRIFLDEITAATPAAETLESGVIILRLPDDYLKLHTLRMADWEEPLHEPEPVESLRWALGANAPDWMICPSRPMVKVERDEKGLHLMVYGSNAAGKPYTLLYIPRPRLDGDTLTLSAAAYPRLLDMLTRQQ